MNARWNWLTAAMIVFGTEGTMAAAWPVGEFGGAATQDGWGLLAGARGGVEEFGTGTGAAVDAALVGGARSGALRWSIAAGATRHPDQYEMRGSGRLNYDLSRAWSYTIGVDGTRDPSRRIGLDAALWLGPRLRWPDTTRARAALGIGAGYGRRTFDHDEAVDAGARQSGLIWTVSAELDIDLVAGLAGAMGAGLYTWGRDIADHSSIAHWSLQYRARGLAVGPFAQVDHRNRPAFATVKTRWTVGALASWNWWWSKGPDP